MDSNTRTQLITSAVNMTGPVGDDPSAWQGQVRLNLAQLTAMTAERSSYSRLIEEVTSAKVFSGTVLAVKREERSTRGLVTLKTRPSEHAEDGTETARTDRTDTPDGLAMARKIQSLKGHRVMVWVYIDEVAGKADRKVRVIKHVEDLGEDAEVMAQIAQAA